MLKEESVFLIKLGLPKARSFAGGICFLALPVVSGSNKTDPRGKCCEKQWVGMLREHVTFQKN